VHEQTKYSSGDLDHDIVEDKEAKSTAAKKPNPMLGVPGQIIGAKRQAAR
jgi:hypothetical protein